jgi:low affinity Fe/Cu permease
LVVHVLVYTVVACVDMLVALTPLALPTHEAGWFLDARSRALNTPMSSPPPQREPRPPTSRIIDGVTDALADEKAFAVSVVLVSVGLILGVVAGRVAQVAWVATLLTFIMVFAVQHTSSRESRALNLKMDELIRVSTARNEFIGAEDESHAQLDERRRELLDDRDVGRRST